MKYNQQKQYLGEVLRRIMRDRHWNQADFARHAGIGEDVLSTWLTGRSMASLKTLKSMAARLEMTVDDFLMPNEPEAAPASLNTVKAEMTGPGMMRLEISAEVPFEVATQIMKLIQG